MKKTMNLVFLLTISSICMPAGRIFQPVMPGTVPESPDTASPSASSCFSPKSACSPGKQLIDFDRQQKIRAAETLRQNAKQAALEESEMKTLYQDLAIEAANARRQQHRQIEFEIQRDQEHTDMTFQDEMHSKQAAKQNENTKKAKSAPAKKRCSIQ